MEIRKKRFWLLYFLMLVLELAVAVIVLRRFGFDFYQGGDSPGYMLLAKNLVEHGTLSFGGAAPYAPTNFRVPGYPLFLAVIYLIFHSFAPAIFFGALISAFAAPLIYLIGKEIFSEKIAFIAGFLTAIEPMGIFLGMSILTEGVFTPVLFFFALLFVKYLKGARDRYLWYAAALLAVAALIRPIVFYFWIFAVPFIFYKTRPDWRLSLKKALIFVAIFFVILAPWLIRNKIAVNSWQITGMQGYIFFIDHYGSVLRYLGQAGPLSDVQQKALSIVGPEKVFTVEGSDTLFEYALNGIKHHKAAYLNVYVKSVGAFFIANGYKSLFIDILGIPAKAPYVPFEYFLRFDFKSIAKTFAVLDFPGFLIYAGSKIVWLAIALLFFGSFFYLLFNKNYRHIRAEIIFLAAIVFYFALITGPTSLGGGRTKAPVNGLILILAVFGAGRLMRISKCRRSDEEKI